MCRKPRPYYIYLIEFTMPSGPTNLFREVNIWSPLNIGKSSYLCKAIAGSGVQPAMKGSYEKGMTVSIKIQVIWDGAALHKLCDNTFCTSSCQTLYSYTTAIAQPGNWFKGFGSITIQFRDRETFNPAPGFVLGLVLSEVLLILVNSWSHPRCFNENFQFSMNWFGRLHINRNIAV